MQTGSPVTRIGWKSDQATFVPLWERGYELCMTRELQRDVVYLGWPIAPSNMSPNSGGGGVLRGLSQ